MVESRNLAGVRTVSAKLRPRPFLLRGIVVGKKQDFRVGVIWIATRRVGPLTARSAAPLPARSSRRDRKNCRRDGSRKDRSGPSASFGSEKKHRAAIGLAGQRLPAHPEIGVRLAVQSPCELEKEEKKPATPFAFRVPLFVVAIYFAQCWLRICLPQSGHPRWFCPPATIPYPQMPEWGRSCLWPNHCVSVDSL